MLRLGRSLTSRDWSSSLSLMQGRPADVGQCQVVEVSELMTSMKSAGHGTRVW